MKNLTWQNPEQLFVAQELINKVKSKCCGIKVHNANFTKYVMLKVEYNNDSSVFDIDKIESIDHFI